MFRNKVVLLALVAIFTLSEFSSFGEGKINDPARNDENLDTRELKSKKEKKASKSSKKGKKSPKSSEKETKDDKSSKVSKNKGELKADVEEGIMIQEELRKLLSYDANDRDECLQRTTEHQNCLYDVLVPGRDFECECRPTTAANVFREVDENDDLFITLDEILVYFEKRPCVFPFKYEWDGVLTEYTECTSDYQERGREWCSIETLANGVHAFGFWKYCKVADTIAEWHEALDSLDSDGDGRLSFDEAITNARRRRMQLGTPWNCNDCVLSEHCRNNIVATIDGECRNYIKTRPFDNTTEDENLLGMLAVTMQDVYCNENSTGYIACATQRPGTENWLTQTHLEMVRVAPGTLNLTNTS